jgi:hypothetical protein
MVSKSCFPFPIERATLEYFPLETTPNKEMKQPREMEELIWVQKLFWCADARVTKRKIIQNTTNTQAELQEMRIWPSKKWLSNKGSIH